jgi:membrane-bound lytic murein transglycosylase C
MHTEAYFNPQAISGSNAIGIMQIIPKYAGREAYRAIYGHDKVISWDYLFDPENNIERGSAYLSLLKYNHYILTSSAFLRFNVPYHFAKFSSRP